MFNLKYKQLITVKESRKLLGDSSKVLTNEELELLISNTETVVRVIFNIKNSSKITKK